MAISPKYLSALHGSLRVRAFSVPSAPFVKILFFLVATARLVIRTGKDKTSVGPSFFRKASFIRAISESPTKHTVTSESRRPISRFTLFKNASRGRRATRTARWRFRIMLAGFLYPDLSLSLRRQFPCQPFRSPRRCRNSRPAADGPYRNPHKRE